jgi:hypothetical protein
MFLLILLAVLAIVFIGLGFTLHWLFIIAVIATLLCSGPAASTAFRNTGPSERWLARSGVYGSCGSPPRKRGLWATS